VIAGLQPLDAGRVTWEGHDLAGVAPHRRRFGLMFQEYALFPHRDVTGNVAFGLRMAGVGRAERDRRVAEVLELVGLAALRDRRVAQLSGGEQQRVALARAFSTRPKVLFADEPTGNLDARTGAGIIDLMTELNRDLGTTLVLVTHDLDLASRARRTIRLADGRIVADTAA
jgi:thiamine transport system ATP-binding protein